MAQTATGIEAMTAPRTRGWRRDRASAKEQAGKPG